MINREIVKVVFDKIFYFKKIQIEILFKFVYANQEKIMSYRVASTPLFRV